MTLVAIEQLEPGMTTTKNVVNKRGQILLPKNIELSDKHIQGLRSWSIKFVDVLQTGDSASTELSSTQQHLVDKYLNLHFVVNAEHETNSLVAMLRECYRETLVSRLAELEKIEANDNVVSEPAPAEKWLTAEHLIQNTKTLHIIPELRRKINSTLKRPDISIAEVSEIISIDPSLSSRLLKMANSAYYGSNYRLNTVTKAATVVGFEDLKSFISETPELDHFSEKSDMNANMHSLWKHNVAVSIYCQLIGQEIGHTEVERLSLMGLLHDIGKLVMYEQIPEYYSDICNYSAQMNTSSMKEERKILGFYHNLISLELLKQWNFSKICQDIVYYHHLPENAVHKREAYILHLADAVAHAMGYNGGIPTTVPIIDPQTLSEIPLKKKVLPGIIAQGQQRIEEITRKILG